MQSKRQSIAIVRLSSLGDVIVSASVLTALKDYEVEWFVDERFAGVLQDSPYIHRLHILPFKKLLRSPLGLWKIWKYCRLCREYDVVVDMQGLIKSAFVGWCLRSKTFIGYDWNGCRESVASLFYTKKTCIGYDENILKRNKALFESILEGKKSAFILPTHRSALGFNFSLVDKQIQALMDGRYYNVMCVLEASIESKQYPIERFVQLMQLMNGVVDSLRVIVVWNMSESRADSFCADLENVHIAYHKMPRLDFNTLKFCISSIDCVIGGDTGVTHLAWAMGRGCITLYGNMSETSGKNMSATKLERVLLGNPYLVSQSGKFEIASIHESDIFKVFIRDIFVNSSSCSGMERESMEQ